MTAFWPIFYRQKFVEKKAKTLKIIFFSKFFFLFLNCLLTLVINTRSIKIAFELQKLGFIAGGTFLFKVYSKNRLNTNNLMKIVSKINRVWARVTRTKSCFRVRVRHPKKSGIPGSGTGSGLRIRTRTRNPVKKRVLLYETNGIHDLNIYITIGRSRTVSGIIPGK